jgi:CubicO group peptidase (beta-lactamase class C family)
MSVPLTRRTLLGLAVGSTAALAVAPEAAEAASTKALPQADIEALEDKIRDGMDRYLIPGVAVGLWSRGVTYLRGFGVTDVDHPAPVTPDTLFRIASTTKTFTGTAIMRLVEHHRIDLDRTVRSYLPDFRTADPTSSNKVTVRQVLNHTAGWLGDFFLDTGTGDDAIAEYVAAMSQLPQLTPPGTTFAYNNAALALAGRLIETTTNKTYEQAVRDLVLEPLGLSHTAYSLDDLPGVSWAMPHNVDLSTFEPVAMPDYWALPRSINAAGGLISSARDQLRWARFQLGSGQPLLSTRTLRSMQSHPGPGGTLFVELDGVGVTWMIRPTAEGPKVIQHGGDWFGQHSGFLMVPERDFALTVLTNSEYGSALTAELFSDDWALQRFAGVSNLPAVPSALPTSELAGYEGTYTAGEVGPDGTAATVTFELVADAGQLSLRIVGDERLRLAFYRPDYTLILAPDGSDAHARCNFVRGADGSVAWLRYGGRLYRRGGAVTALTTTGDRMPKVATLPYPAAY